MFNVVVIINTIIKIICLFFPIIQIFVYVRLKNNHNNNNNNDSNNKQNNNN